MKVGQVKPKEQRKNIMIADFIFGSISMKRKCRGSIVLYMPKNDDYNYSFIQIKFSLTSCATVIYKKKVY